MDIMDDLVTEFSPEFLKGPMAKLVIDIRQADFVAL